MEASTNAHHSSAAPSPHASGSWSRKAASKEKMKITENDYATDY